MEQRIIQLETLFALQDEVITNLNNELYKQQQDTEKLRRKLEELEEKLSDLQNAGEICGNERPPHY